MSPCCKTCDHRQHAVQDSSSTRPPLEVVLIVLEFQNPMTPANSASRTALNILLNSIIDAAETTSHPTTFTTWSPCLSNPKTVAIFTTASETCRDSTSVVFTTVLKHLSSPPSVRHLYLDCSVVSLAASSPDERIPCDIVVLKAPNSGVASAIGKHFGWDPSRSSLSTQLGACGPARFSKPGDLIHDFWAWAELQPSAPISPSSSIGSGYESSESRPTLLSINSEEKNMSLFYAEDEGRRNMEDETLVMIFQWKSHADADRFKHPLQKSHGQNGQEVSHDLWDRHVAHPLRHATSMGAKADILKLELRGVEPRMGKAAARERSGSARFSAMASGFGDRVSGLWGR